MNAATTSRRLVAAMIAFALVVPAPGHASDGLSAEAVFSRNGVLAVEVAPRGDWLAASVRSGRTNGILVQRIGVAKVQTLIATEATLRNMWWVAPDRLLAVFDQYGSRQYALFHVQMIGGTIFADQDRFTTGGWLVATDVDDAESVLWAHRLHDQTTIYRMTFAQLGAWGEQRDPHNHAFPSGEKLLSVRGDARNWIIDANDVPRAYVRHRDDRSTIFFRPAARSGFVELYESGEDQDPEQALTPVGLSTDGERLVVMGRAGSDTVGLHELAANGDGVERTLLRRPDVDVEGAITRRGVVVGATVIEDGFPRPLFLDEFRSRFAAPLRKLDQRFAPELVTFRTASQDESMLVFRTSGPTNPGEFFVHDIERDLDHPIGRYRAEVARSDLSPMQSFVTTSSDGMEIEAYLTMPTAREGPAPLVVYPHGGPVGVRDLRVYDPLVQYLASWGFAVLQPNYRGSGGYGRRFEKAGHKKWATGIEDDIDAAVDHVIQHFPVDATRLCIAGASYGGFSALTSVVRHQDRYRCAISINGVSDVPLNMTTRDHGFSKRLLDLLAELVGDPKTERERLVEISPAFRAQQIETPVYLIYGSEDKRVDPDHSHRMMLMLDLYGKEWDALEVEGMAHSPDLLEWVIVARAVRRQLTRHLMPKRVFVPDPEIGEQGVGRVAPRYGVDF